MPQLTCGHTHRKPPHKCKHQNFLFANHQNVDVCKPLQLAVRCHTAALEQTGFRARAKAECVCPCPSVPASEPSPAWRGNLREGDNVLHSCPPTPARALQIATAPQGCISPLFFPPAQTSGWEDAVTAHRRQSVPHLLYTSCKKSPSGLWGWWAPLRGATPVVPEKGMSERSRPGQL